MVLTFVPVYGAVWFLSDNPILAFNVTVFVAYLAGALAVFLLARLLLGELLPALVAAAAFSFSTYRSVGVEHVQLAGFAFVVLALFFVIRFLELRRWLDAVALGVVAAGTWLTSGYFAVLLAIVGTAFVGTWLLQQRVHPGARFWRGMGLAALVAALVAGPTLLPYLRLQRSGAFAFGDVTQADLEGFARFPPSLVYRDVPPDLRVHEDENAFFPGIVLSGLAVVAFTGSRRRSRAVATARTKGGRYVLPFAVSALACGLVMLGPDRWGPIDWPYRVLREVVPGLATVREVTRFWVYPLLCLSLLAGAGARHLLHRWRSRQVSLARLATAGALVALICVEMLYRPGLATLDLSASRMAPYERLADLPPGPVTEVPVAFGWLSPYVLAPRQLRSLTDGNPRVEGYSGSFPDSFYTMQAIASAFPEPVAIDGLRRYGVRYVIVHTNDFPCLGAFGPKESEHLRARLDQTPGVVRVIEAADDLVVELEGAPIDHGSLPAVPPVVRPVYPCPDN
jgi:hypothetical protein